MKMTSSLWWFDSKKNWIKIPTKNKSNMIMTSSLWWFDSKKNWIKIPTKNKSNMIKKWFVNLLERILSYNYGNETYLLEYAKRSRHFAESKSSAIFANNGIRHKEIILSDIFHTAEKYVKIYYPNFDDFNSKNVLLINAITKFLEQDNVECKIILNTYKLDSCIIQLFEKYKDKVEINILPTIYLNDMIHEFNDGGMVYLVFSDSRMFRLETSEYAYCCYNDEEKTKILEKVFDKYYKLIKNEKNIQI